MIGYSGKWSLVRKSKQEEITRIPKRSVLTELQVWHILINLKIHICQFRMILTPLLLNEVGCLMYAIIDVSCIWISKQKCDK